MSSIGHSRNYREVVSRQLLGGLVQDFLPTTADIDLGAISGQTFRDIVADSAAPAWVSNYHQPFKLHQVRSGSQPRACHECDLSLEVENLVEVQTSGHDCIDRSGR